MCRSGIDNMAVRSGIDNMAVQGRWPLTAGVAQGRYNCSQNYQLQFEAVIKTILNIITCHGGYIFLAQAASHEIEF